MLADEVNFALQEVGNWAKRETVSGPLAFIMLETTRNNLELWRKDHRLLSTFAEILSNLTTRNLEANFLVTHVTMEEILSKLFYRPVVTKKQ